MNQMTGFIAQNFSFAKHDCVCCSFLSLTNVSIESFLQKLGNLYQIAKSEDKEQNYVILVFYL